MVSFCDDSWDLNGMWRRYEQELKCTTEPESNAKSLVWPECGNMTQSLVVEASEAPHVYQESWLRVWKKLTCYCYKHLRPQQISNQPINSTGGPDQEGCNGLVLESKSYGDWEFEFMLSSAFLQDAIYWKPLKCKKKKKKKECLWKRYYNPLSNSSQNKILNEKE